MAYTVGRFWVEALRSDQAIHFLGMWLNDWVSIAVFLGALLYFVLVKGPQTRIVTTEDGQEVTSAAQVLTALAYDVGNQSAIAGSISAARENARGTRETISAEIFEALNATWMGLGERRRGADRLGPQRAHGDWCDADQPVAFGEHPDPDFHRGDGAGHLGDVDPAVLAAKQRGLGDREVRRARVGRRGRLRESAPRSHHFRCGADGCAGLARRPSVRHPHCRRTLWLSHRERARRPTRQRTSARKK